MSGRSSGAGRLLLGSVVVKAAENAAAFVEVQNALWRNTNIYQNSWTTPMAETVTQGKEREGGVAYFLT